MKKVISILLVLSIISQSFVNIGIVLYYHLNKAYITQKLCENRRNPNMHCNGKCYLGKQLKKAEEGEKRGATNILKEKDEIVLNRQHSLSVICNPLDVMKCFIPYQVNEYDAIYQKHLLKPPLA